MICIAKPKKQYPTLPFSMYDFVEVIQTKMLGRIVGINFNCINHSDFEHFKLLKNPDLLHTKYKPCCVTASPYVFVQFIDIPNMNVELNYFPFINFLVFRYHYKQLRKIEL